MSKKLFIFSLFVVLLPNIVAYDLSDFPEPFFVSPCTNTHFIVGSSLADGKAYGVLSSELILVPIAIRRHYCGPEPSSAVVDSEFNTEKLSKQNVILFGGPCANNITAQVMGLSTKWPECTLGFENGVGRIILYNKWNKTQLIVAGYSEEDTKKAAEVLAAYKDKKYNLTFNELGVIGELNNLSLFSVNIDSKLQNSFLNKDKIEVTISLKDLTHISFPSSATSKEKQDIYEYNKKLKLILQNQVISTLNETEFDAKHISSAGNGFTGTITKNGFEKLRRNPLVLFMYEPIKGTTT